MHFHCDVNYDPFLYMEDNNKTYGFTITMYEFHATIPTLWDTVKSTSCTHALSEQALNVSWQNSSQKTRNTSSKETR